eukprot:1157310-Pelagomonas_calceolata.AAC.6
MYSSWCFILLDESHDDMPKTRTDKETLWFAVHKSFQHWRVVYSSLLPMQQREAAPPKSIRDQGFP